jgi:Transglutaminase-like superfamily
MTTSDPLSIDRGDVPGVQRPHPRGMQGLVEGLRELASRMERAYKRRPVIAWARRTIHEAQIPGERGHPDARAEAQAIFEALKRETSFVADPHDVEAMAQPEQLLCLDPHGFCVRAGDCDDLVLAAGAALMAIGIPVRLVLRFYENQNQAHLTLEYDASGPAMGGVWVGMDPSVDSGVPSSAHFIHQITQEVHMVSGDYGTFVGIGEPPARELARELASGTMGDPPPTLPPDQEAFWIDQLSQTKLKLDASIARLRAKSQALAAVRADLGLPQYDPSPSGEGQPAMSPLAQYVSSHAWTAEAAAAESKLLATADFMSSAFADGLSGKRALYWNNNDLGVAAQPGDPFRVLMAKDPNTGTVVPTYFDPVTNQQLGTMGILPIIIGLIALVGTIAVGVAIWKITDYLASSHHDDMVGKIAAEQQALVDAGKQTPEQAAAFLKAATDLSNSGPPKAPTGIEFPWWSLAIAALAGGLAVFFAPKLLESAAGAVRGRFAPVP